MKHSLLCLRMDDVGASSKQFEVYSNTRWANVGPLKSFDKYKAWGRYDELTAETWEEIFCLLVKKSARLEIGITASWVDQHGACIPFPEMFPEQAALISDAVSDGLISVSNHGYSHCVVGKHRPRLFTSNRKWHREFWDWLPREIHQDHLEKSQSIFGDWLGFRPTNFIPPGNVYAAKTVSLLKEFGIETVNSSTKPCPDEFFSANRVRYVDCASVVAFHDREISMYGVRWMSQLIEKKRAEYEFCFIKDLCVSGD